MKYTQCLDFYHFCRLLKSVSFKTRRNLYTVLKYGISNVFYSFFTILELFIFESPGCSIQMTCIFFNRHPDFDLKPLPLSGAYFPDCSNLLDKDLVCLNCKFCFDSCRGMCVCRTSRS